MNIQQIEKLIETFEQLIFSNQFLNGEYKAHSDEIIIENEEDACIIAVEQDFEYLEDERFKDFYCWTEILEDFSSIPIDSDDKQFVSREEKKALKNKFNENISMPLFNIIGPKMQIHSQLIGPIEACLDDIFDFKLATGTLHSMHEKWLDIFQNGGEPIGWKGAYKYHKKGYLKSEKLPKGQLVVYNRK